MNHDKHGYDTGNSKVIIPCGAEALLDTPLSWVHPSDRDRINNLTSPIVSERGLWFIKQKPLPEGSGQTYHGSFGVTLAGKFNLP